MKARHARLESAGATDPVVVALLLGGLPLLAAPSWPVGLALMAGLDLALLAAWGYDVLGARARLAALEPGFQAPAMLLAGKAASLTLELANPEPEPLEVLAQAAWGPAMGQAAAPLPVLVPPCGTAAVGLPVQPLAPGEHTHERLVLRTTGPLGLARVDVSLAAPATFTVRQAAVAPPPGPARPPAAVRQDGGRPRPERAQEGEAASIRAYQPGDSMRAIHWKATARRGRAVVREYEAERRDHTWIVLECGRGMAAARDGLPQYRAALAGVLGAARRLVEAGGVVSVVAVDSKVRAKLEGVDAAGELAALGRELAKVEPSALEPDLAGLTPLVARARRKGDRVLVVSARSARSLRTEAVGVLAGWAGRHRVGLVRLPEPDGPGEAPVPGGDLFRDALDGLERLQAGHAERDLARDGVAWVAAEPGRFGEALMDAVARTGPGRRRGRGAGRRGGGRA